ncbi:MAG: protein translocase subunit yidC [Chitinophagaceae bacterium]|nr:protein translocase subunit yidC [Chitinophagaceae bacterium]
MMDRNQTIGLVLFAVLTIAYFFFMSNQAPEQPVAQAVTTSVAKQDSTTATPIKPVVAPTGAIGTQGENKEVVLENEELKITFQTQGAIIKDVLVKRYLTFDKKPLHLVSPANNFFALNGLNRNNTPIDLYSLFYESSQTKNAVTFSVTDSTGNKLTHTYTLPDKGFALDYEIGGSALKTWLNIAAPLELVWNNSVDKIEYDAELSRAKTTVNYYTPEEGFDQLDETTKDKVTEVVERPLKWVSLKQKFFNAGIIAKNNFQKAELSNVPTEAVGKIKNLSAKMTIPAASIQKDTLAFKFFFGPNQYQICKAVGDDYEKNVYLGWPVINGINRFVVVPVFNFLEGKIANYGVIIIILVLLIKLLLLPLSYKSYVSMAKMKVMKPELDEIKAEHGDDAQKVQAAQMKLYQQVGINPLSGCIPVLLQMPILVAMFNFFPNSFELRQQAFLWAPDLSTYDYPILLPFTVPFGYGSHVSIFTILMTISTLAYTYINNQVSTAATGPMKILSYAMPVIFMFVLNSFPAGLSFYYLMSNVVTIGQQLIIRRFVDETSLKAKLDENRVKIASGQGGKKSKWMQRVEDAMKAQEDIKKNKKK